MTDSFSTPLRERIDQIIEDNKMRMYMPGHKGKLPYPFEEVAPYDITEIDGADSLYHSSDVLREIEDRIAAAYHAGASLLSASGSSLCIQTMLYLANRRGRKIIAARNSHQIAVNTFGLLRMDVMWVKCKINYSDEQNIRGIALQPTAEEIEKMLQENTDTASVYITSPDYFGQIADIPQISEVCKRYGVWLLVDNAHGAHLNRFRAALHPIVQGADMCCDSLHKNYPVLTGGAVLHLAESKFRSHAKYAMSLFGTTSPSYLIMLSADMALPYIEGSDDKYLQLGAYISNLKERLYKHGYETVRSFVSDPLRLAVGFHSMGYLREEMSYYLYRRDIQPEYVFENTVIFMPSLSTTLEELQQLELVLTQLPMRRPIPQTVIQYVLPRRPLSIHEAMARPAMQVPIEDAQGRVSARLISKCPPGIPIVTPGEEISNLIIQTLKNTGIKFIYVVK